MRHRALTLSMLLALGPLMGQEAKAVQYDPVTGAPITSDEKVIYDPVTGLPVSGLSPAVTPAFDPVTGAPVTGPVPASRMEPPWTGLSDAQIVRFGNRNARRDHKPLSWIIGGGIVSLTGLGVGAALGGSIMGGGGALVGMGLGAYAATDAVTKVRVPVRVPLQLSAAPYEKRALYRQEYRKTARGLRMKNSFLGIPAIIAGFIALGMVLIGF